MSATSGRCGAGRLLVCATPIGNLEDVTLRVLRVLGEADVLACEDTRRTRVLLDRHGIRAARLVSLHEHNERARARELAGADAGGRDGCARQRCRHAADLRPRLSRWCASASRRSCRSRCCRGRARCRLRWSPPACPWPAGASSGSCHASAVSANACSADAAETLVAFESPRRLSATLEHARAARSAASRGGVPRADQAARGSRARVRGRARGALSRASLPRGRGRAAWLRAARAARHAQ